MEYYKKLVKNILLGKITTNVVILAQLVNKKKLVISNYYSPNLTQYTSKVSSYLAKLQDKLQIIFVEFYWYLTLFFFLLEIKRKTETRF